MSDAAPSVVLYTHAGCADSPKVRAWLTEHGIPFDERDVTTDPEAAAALLATGTFATPLLVIGEQQVLGFQPELFAALLGLSSPTGAIR